MPEPLNVIRLQDAPAQPWRNGGGVTRELLAWSSNASQSADADAAPWDLRVSVADITRDGPFSAFPGISRCFAVLEGDGVELMFDGRSQRLSAADDAVRFDGGAAPGCRLLGGPTRDLNLMVRANAGRASMARATRGVPQTGIGRWRAVYVHGPSVVDVGADPQMLPAAGLAWIAAPTQAGRGGGEQALHLPWTLIEGGPACWLWLEAAD